MFKDPVSIIPKVGIRLDLDAFREVNLESGDKTLLSDVENRDNILFSDDAPLKPFLARFVRIEDGAAVFEAKSPDSQRTELLCRSRPLEVKHGVADNVKRGLENAYADLRSKASQPGVTAEAREFISSLRLADPQESPELYRVVKHNGKQHLFVIWGIVRNDGSEMYPVDAIERIPSHKARRSLLTGLLAVAAIILFLLLLWPFIKDRVNSEELAGDTSADPRLLPKTDSDEPPFLIVQPQAIVVGERVNIVPRNVGELTVSSHDGQEFLHREAKGVKDRESLQLFAAGVRKVDFKPANKSFADESLGLIIYPTPLVRQNAVRLSFPIGVDLEGVYVDWGDGSAGPVESLERRLAQHIYNQIGTYEISVRFPDTLKWASHNFTVEILDEKK